MRDKYNRKIDYLRLSITDRCNLRCIYCMEENSKEFLDNNKLLTDDEIIKIVKVASNLGIKKVRLTGGEPLVREGIVSLVKRINNIDGISEIYITTNGILLDDKIVDLYNNGLKGINISLDSLKVDRFKEITRVGELGQVISSMNKALELGVKVKVNIVLIDEINYDEIVDFVRLSIDKKIDVRFIELMPIGIGKIHKGITNNEVLKNIKTNFKYKEIINKEELSGPASYIKVQNSKGRVGFISAISSCFCENCNRIRITSDGFLKQCLHYKSGIDLKELLRKNISEDELQNIIKDAIYTKPEKNKFNSDDNNVELKLMNEIGG